MSYKMICMDMDDTLLKNDKSVSPENRIAILAAMEKGVKAVICTGRAIYSIEKYLDMLDMKREGGCAVCLNGSTAYDVSTGELIMDVTFQKEDYHFLIETGHEFGADMQAYRNRTFYTEALTPRVEGYCKRMNVTPTVVSNLGNLNIELNKVLYNGDTKLLSQMKKYLDEKVEGKVNMYFSSPELLEFTSLKASKGLTMIELGKRMGIKREEIIGVGDSFNDMHMIEMAGLGVAVQNARQEVKDIADYVTENTNETDAIKEVIEKFIL